MGDYNINQMNSFYQSCADQAYQDDITYSSYKFLCQLEKDCLPPRTYSLPNNLTEINKFWVVD